MITRSLILPGDIEFEQTLSNIPPNWLEVANKNNGNYAFVADSETGLLRTVNGDDFREYLLGGEYDERLATMGYGWDAGFTEDDLEGVDTFYIDL